MHSDLALPIRILVTGDTHLGPRRDWLPIELVEGLGQADLTIHTGDYSSPEALELFRKYGPLLGVTGNNDGPVLLDELPEQLSLRAGDLAIEVTHGHRERGSSALAAVTATYAGNVDLVIFGHSHRPYWEEVNGTWFLNPGSPTMRRREPRFSFAMLEIERSGKFKANFRYFESQRRSDAGD